MITFYDVLVTILILIGILGFIFAVRGVHAKSKLFDVGLILLIVSYLALIIISGSISK